MQSLADFQCPICLQLCKDAVQSKCCGHAFCSNCASDFVNANKICPYCRQQNFKVVQSRILRRVISGIKVSCPNIKCQKKISHGDLDQHVGLCQYTLRTCKFCKTNFLLGELFTHTIQRHSDEAKKIIIQSHIESKDQEKKLSQLNKSANIKQVVITLTGKIYNRKNKEVFLGQTQKHYCGGPLGFKCKCCDGNCGPTNGENCADCMALDIKIRSLPKGYLVNTDGCICSIPENRKPYCGTCITMLGYSSYRCNSQRQCPACIRMTLTLPRYQEFL